MKTFNAIDQISGKIIHNNVSAFTLLSQYEENMQIEEFSSMINMRVNQTFLIEALAIVVERRA